jgi:hypothetical protein
MQNPILIIFCTKNQINENSKNGILFLESVQKVYTNFSKGQKPSEREEIGRR